VGTAELAAVAFGFAYILLAIREHRACWVAGGVGTAIYAVVFLDAALPLQAALQLLYVALSAYGWLSWGRTAPDARAARSWPIARHLAALAAVGAATAVSAPLAARYALAAAPVADSLGAWASVVATWLLARRIIDTWIWWMVIDAGLAALVAQQGLWPTAALYLAYACLAAAGWRSWQARRAAP
jgi:nicotinamide mononucleotide transporter